MLTVKGITFLLGNELAGTRVRPSDPEDTLMEVRQSKSVTPCQTSHVKHHKLLL